MRTSAPVLFGRVILIGCGIAIIAVTAVFADTLKDNGVSMWFAPVAAGLGFVLTGTALASRWQKAAFWFSVAMVGQALSLQMINAGYQLRYQHYKPVGELLQFPTVLYVLAMVVQAVLVGVGIRGVLAGAIGWVRSNVRPWQLIVLALCFFLPTTTVSPDVSVYVIEFAIAGVIQLLALATFILFANAIPKESISTLRELMKDREGEPPRYGLAIAAAIFVAVLAVVLNIFSYEQHPHVPDEVAYLMQARFFAAGVFTMPAPAVPEAFDVYLMKVDGDVWYPVTPPGWAFLLAAGAFVGAPYVVNPILAALNILLSYWLVARLYSVSTARLTVILLATSPWFIFLAMSYMTHMAALTCLLVAAVGVVKARETENWTWGLVSGIAIGFISVIRPLEAVAVAGLVGLWTLGLGGKRLSVRSIAAVGFATLLVGGLGLAYNAKLSGDPLQFPINSYTDEVFGKNSNAYGFGPDRGMGWQLDPYPGHGPVDALVNTNLNVSALNTELSGWWIGSFLMIGAFLCFGKMRRSDYLMIAVIGVIYALHFFYYFSGGPDFGARYWFLMIVPLVALTVRGIAALATRLAEFGRDADVRLYAMAGALAVLTIAVFVPWRAADKYHNFRGMKPDIRTLTDEFQFGRSLVLIQGNKHPDYDSAFIYNALDVSGDGPVYAWDKDVATREKLLAAYPDRPVWIVRSPSVTGGDYQVAAGPLDTNALLAAHNQ